MSGLSKSLTEAFDKYALALTAFQQCVLLDTMERDHLSPAQARRELRTPESDADARAALTKAQQEFHQAIIQEARRTQEIVTRSVAPPHKALLMTMLLSGEKGRCYEGTLGRDGLLSHIDFKCLAADAQLILDEAEKERTTA